LQCLHISKRIRIASGLNH